jgi:hypothetical protein
MRNYTLFVVLAGCAANSPTPQRPLGATEHYAEARAHDQAAEEHDLAASAEQRSARTLVTCGDQVLSDQSTSGGVPLTRSVPCWTHVSQRDAHLRRAAAQRREARVHREIAARLIEAERVACAAVAEDERDHTPTWHTGDIVAVEPVRDGGPVAGARIVFRKIPGLTADWLRASYACQQAQAAAEGYDPTFASYCPSTLEGVTIEVSERADGFVVTFRADRPEVGAVVWGRASDLVPGTGPTAALE